jgi:choline dehydrogenase
MYDIYIVGIRKVQQLSKTKTMMEIGMNGQRFDFYGICDKIKYDSDEYWECVLRHFAITCYHPTCTCRMGSSSDKTAVVDPQLR